MKKEFEARKYDFRALKLEYNVEMFLGRTIVVVYSHSSCWLIQVQPKPPLIHVINQEFFLIVYLEWNMEDGDRSRGG